MPNLDSFAAAIHETWRDLSAQQGWKMPLHLDQPCAGLALTATGPAIPSEILESHMEILAEAEHNGWMAHRTANGWTYGATRDDAAKRHPSMIPYADLPETEKEKDRGNIRHYPAFAARAGLCITSAA